MKEFNKSAVYHTSAADIVRNSVLFADCLVNSKERGQERSIKKARAGD